MASVDIGADDVSGGIADDLLGNLSIVLDSVRANASRLARAVAVAAVNDHAVDHDNRVPLAVRFDVSNERLELLALHERKQVGSGMKAPAFHDVAPSLSPPCGSRFDGLHRRRETCL